MGSRDKEVTMSCAFAEHKRVKHSNEVSKVGSRETQACLGPARDAIEGEFRALSTAWIKTNTQDYSDRKLEATNGHLTEELF